MIVSNGKMAPAADGSRPVREPGTRADRPSCEVRSSEEQKPMSAEKMTDHQRIRKWAEQHGGNPAKVSDTAGTAVEGLIRLDFDEDDEGLERIGWDEWLAIFDAHELALLAEPDSRFNKLVARD
jgi:hypothetical protein